MTRDRVLISCKLIWDALEGFAPVFDAAGVDYEVADVPGQQLSAADLLPIIERYDGVLAGDDEFTADVITAGKRLRVISKWGIGVDAIDHDAARSHNVAVYNTPGVFEDELADYALGFLIMLARRQHEVDREVRTGTWHKVRGESLAGKTLGIVGLGSSGKALARRAAVLGMTVVGYDPVPPTDPFLADTGCTLMALTDVRAAADIVSLHIPATDSTSGMIDDTRIGMMRKGAWLINISRGSLVDEAALCRALDSGQIGAAALDVFEHEPLPEGSPLSGRSNVILGSHNGSNTHQAVTRTNERAVANLLKGLGRNSDRGT